MSLGIKNYALGMCGLLWWLSLCVCCSNFCGWNGYLCVSLVFLHVNLSFSVLVKCICLNIGCSCMHHGKNITECFVRNFQHQYCHYKNCIQVSGTISNTGWVLEKIKYETAFLSEVWFTLDRNVQPLNNNYWP